MSGLVAILGAPGALEESTAQRMLAASQARGAARVGTWVGEQAVLGVGRHEWEMAGDFAAGTLVLEAAGVVVAADASLYYRDDLRRALKAEQIRVEGASPSHLIAAAYQAWGTALVERLEGDFAFVLWDVRRRRVLAARDPGGSRPLYFAPAGARLVLASGLTAVVAHPAVDRRLNPLALAEAVVCSSSRCVSETVYAAVEQLPAGGRLVWESGKAPVVDRFWEPPVFEQDHGPDAADAAEQLRAVLSTAVKERLGRESRTAVWTSGGYDSTAIFALAHRAAPVIPVSMSYPEGDPGREDELIQLLASHTGASVRWLRIGDVAGLPDPVTWAARRDQPFAHPYEEWNRALARESVSAGARVVLSGNGGDQFFSVSPVFLADLARRGQWLELYREAREIGLGPRRFRDLFHWAVQPALPASLLELAAALRGGRHLKPHLVTAVPGWLGLAPELAAELIQRQWHYRLRRDTETFGSAESAWYFTTSFGQRVCGTVMDLTLQEGAEVRSPFYDRRVLEFIARRPRSDRFARGENKRLLRQAMSALLPPEILARRQRRTGLPSSYLRRVYREALPGWVDRAGARWRLEELGLVSAGAARAAAQRYQATPKWEGGLGSELFHLLSTEYWLSAHQAGTAMLTGVAA